MQYCKKSLSPNSFWLEFRIRNAHYPLGETNWPWSSNVYNKTAFPCKGMLLVNISKYYSPCGPYAFWNRDKRSSDKMTIFYLGLWQYMHNIGKASVNASIFYKNLEKCNKTNLWKIILRENSKNAFSIFVFILMAGVFVSRDENSLLDLISLIIRKR